MPRPQPHLEEVLGSEPGPHIAALFDFDGTIIAGYSATAMLREKFQRREMSVEEIAETAQVIAQHSLGNIGFSGLMTAAAKFMKGVDEESFVTFGEELYKKHIARKIYPETRAIIEAHRAKGHRVAIVSSATIYQIEPTARDLGITDIKCSAYEIEDGVFTGEIVRPLCFGEGKVLAAEDLAAEHGLDLDQSFFYSDSDDDIELLERVGKPRPLNPNLKLKAIADERGWPVQRFASRGTPSWVDYTRTIYATGSLVGAFAAGLPIWALTRSQREAVNFSLGLFGDFATAITGVELEVEDERHLWSARPCVFIFNHQSKADVMILAKLIRRDMGAVGKKEIRDIPILGKLMEWGGTVFVDRADGKSAIRAMEPLVDAIRQDGKSICIAPEGTRTLTPKLGAFKKGAFHLAMQAGVPIVPIVIHNATDVAPKNEFVMRPATVRVTVLPPVDTSGWSVRSLASHVREVRNMFLRTLGQAEEEGEVEPAKKPPPGKAAAKPKKAAAKKPSPRKGRTA
ncbi:putative phosphoserine phosphatase/1-acylglycerol-3-phosphate O-acyltransferase [Sphingopyxis panaciterrulae]|uniref:1-acyl-sn-glycerol-3-phosphate acyltransferase n=1 Tax=Sphingopyxis panaciterrulae TaxID=462372 RepID=A0A7W9ESG2_9SPHN|nr:putative phosphoserine phosphatase/1-acylglycerol-3-phosphate O-acyltransferase [Sphingopyxis panaciterrulae]